MKTHGDAGGQRGRRRGSLQGQKTLAAILTAAGDLASLEGLERLSMGRLASSVAMSKSGLYAHFRSKEELQLATIRHAVDVFEAEVVRGPSDPEGGLDALLERWLRFFEHRVFPGGCFVLVAAVEFAGRPGPVREALALAVDNEIAVLKTAIERGTETGVLRSGAEVSQTAFELHAILMNAHAVFQITRDVTVFDHARAAIRRVLAGIGRPHSPTDHS